MSSNSPIRLANERIAISIDSGTGKILSLRNLTQGMDLIWSALDTPPWRIEIEHEPAWLERFSSFSYTLDDENPSGASANLRWETEYGLSVSSQVSLPREGDSIFFTVAIQNSGSLPVDKIEYPIITGIGLMGRRGGSTRLVHSQGTGFLYYDPERTFLPEPGRNQGLRYSPYPEGFNGSTMQFMAYFMEGQGGFYFATRDPGKTMKWFNFYKDADSAALAATFMHQAPGIAPGLDFAPDYPVEISLLYRGDWYEAADRYKEWAVQQEWCKQGRLEDRAERARWLLEEAGICTFGVNAAYDRARWLDAFHRMAGTPVFHILGPNWAQAGQDYQGHLPSGSLDDWLPARFSAENLETIRSNGDRWAPFEFDLLCTNNAGRSEGQQADQVLANRQVLPTKKYSFDRYWFPFMCPATPFWHDLHVERDARIIQDYRPDSIYYDISLNNVLMACRSHSHPHQPGGGQEIADAFAGMLCDTKAAMSRAAGGYVPIGTEMVTELVIPFVDYYQARAEASPSSNFEADFWRAWLVQGKVEKIPLFAYVYHEYGPLRMDGWGKLSAEVGDVFYWVASRVTLWGGLFELNYEFSALEKLNDRTDDPLEHYYPFEPAAYEISPEKAAFVGEVARARTTWANSYLAYGTMLQPPELNVPVIELDYFLTNAGKDIPHYGEKGVILAPSVVCAAWRYRGERAAVFFVNLQKTAQTIEVTLEQARFGLDNPAPANLSFIVDGKASSIGTLDGRKTLSLDLPPRRIAAVELTH
jgi:hypothetical protein